MTFAEIDSDELDELLDSARALKAGQKEGRADKPLKEKTGVLIFEKPSTRTRVSFEVAFWQLGGLPIVLNSTDMQLGRGETIEDTGQVISRYTDIVVIRSNKHENVTMLAKAATVPVINALSDMYHPCQALADMFTIKEIRGGLRGRKMAYIGDGNNVCNSLMLAAATAGLNISVATPYKYAPDRGVEAKALEIAAKKDSKVIVTEDLAEAVKDADVLYTDVWVSMGDEKEAESRKNELAGYQLNERVLGMAKEDAIVMHCMPAHRGEEITGSVFDGPRSVVLDQAENRLHAQKALLKWLLTIA